MFADKYTTIKCFQTPTKECANVPMMQVVDTFHYNYIPHLDAQVIVLPYNVKLRKLNRIKFIMSVLLGQKIRNGRYPSWRKK